MKIGGKEMLGIEESMEDTRKRERQVLEDVFRESDKVENCIYVMDNAINFAAPKEREKSSLI